MTQYETEKLTLTDQNEVVKKKEQFGEVVLNKEIEQLKNKLILSVVSQNKTKEEIIVLKVRISELQASEQALKTEHAELNGKYQTALRQLEDERRTKQRV